MRRARAHAKGQPDASDSSTSNEEAKSEAEGREEPNGQRTIYHRERGQLSFVTGQRGEPDLASIKIAGSLPVARDIMKQTGVIVRVTTISGEVIAERQAACTNLAFPDKTDSYGITTTERVHTVTLQ